MFLFVQLIKMSLIYEYLQSPDFELYTQPTITTLQEIGEISEVIKREVLVKARLGFSSEYLVLELAAYLVRLLCPTFRPVNIQVFLCNNTALVCSS